MCLGALLGAGYPKEELRRQIAILGLPGVGLNVEPVKRAGLAATRVRVMGDQNCESQPIGGGHSPHRHLSQIRSLFETSDLDPEVARRALRVFEALARAEAAVHGCSPEEVHFHEVGAVDAIVDIVGTVAGLRFLGIERVVCSALTLGFGQVRSAHGLLPVPAPAVLELLRQWKDDCPDPGRAGAGCAGVGRAKEIPVRGGDLEGEFVTPTGAALMVTLANEFGALPPMRVESVGYGAGSMDPPGRPNVLRLVVGEEAVMDVAVRKSDHIPRGEGPDKYSPERMVVIETEIDDLNPEFFGPLIEKLLEAGALDASLVPILMKKGRPGQLLRVLVRPENREVAARIIFSETSTLGLRLREEIRWKLPRRVIEVRVEAAPGDDECQGHPVSVKIGLDPETGDVLTVSPEFEDCRRAAQALGRPLRAVYDEARDLARALVAGAAQSR